MQLYYSEFDCLVGRLKLVAHDKALVAILWGRETTRVKLPLSEKQASHPVLKLAERELTEYFSGKRKNFEIPLDLNGTDFQKEVWQALKTIPYGGTVSYKDIACHVGRPKAVRAVGTAIGKNPISIILPCHRVIGADGSLSAFAGGLPIKKILLRLEGSIALG